MTDVTQEDRIAAASLTFLYEAPVMQSIRSGEADHLPLVQAFAAHRQATASSLAAENERLKLALKPFSDAADECDGAPDDMEIGEASYEVVTVGHCRAARAALKGE